MQLLIIFIGQPWQKGMKNGAGRHAAAPAIEAGDAGIWVTCDLNKEGKCTAELTDLFDEVRATLPCVAILTRGKFHLSWGINAFFCLE